MWRFLLANGAAKGYICPMVRHGRAYRRFSARIALAAIAALLFAQGALAAYVCKKFDVTDLSAATPLTAPPCHQSDSDRDDVLPADALCHALCHAHCFVPGASVDNVPAFSAVQPTSALAVTPVEPALHPCSRLLACAEPHASGPPLIFRFVRLLN